MKTFKGISRAIAVLVCIGLVLFFRDATGSFLSGVKDMVQQAFESASDRRACESLNVEYQALKEEYASSRACGTEAVDAKFLIADVYSRYPFSDRNLLVVNKGSGDGVRPGMPVRAARGVLVGKVSAVRGTQSEVETIFNPAWKTSVAVGSAKTRAVLQGGNTPRLELIPKDAPVIAGDSVVNITPDFPFGLLVGSATDVRDDDDNIWRIADLEVPYTIEDLRTVEIVLDFP